MAVPPRRRAARLDVAVLPASGALIYSTIVYFGYELLAESHRASLFWVFVVNIPWTLAPVLLILRLGQLLPPAAPPARAPRSRRKAS